MTQRIAVGLTLLAALFATACSGDPKPQSEAAATPPATVAVAPADAREPAPPSLAEASPSEQPASASAGLIGATGPSRVSFTQQPVNTEAGVTLPAVRVAVQDAAGKVVTTARGMLSLELVSGNGATLGGTKAIAVANGVATFYTLNIPRAGTGYTLRARFGTLPPVASTPFNITPGAVEGYAVVSQVPATAVAGESLGTIQVEAQDRFGNRVTSYGDFGELVAVGVDPEFNPAGAAVIGGAREVPAINGVATFEGLALDKVGQTSLLFVGYDANFLFLYLGYSSPVTITPAAASAMAFRAMPAETKAGSALAPAVQVQVTDRFGNATSGGGNVTLTLGANPGGDTLQGTLTQPVTNGLATFADVSLRKAGRGYTLKASQTGLTPATSLPFAIIGADAARLEFAAQPRSTPNGLPLNEVAVRLVDAFGNTATSAGEVTLALGNANGAALAGTVRVAAQDGVARFGDLSVDRGGQGYVLAASSGSLTGADSSPFDVYNAALAYTDPAGGRIRLMRHPTSTNTRLVLDVVAAEELTGYGAGFNLPLDATKVRLPAQGALTPGAILSVGSSTPAVAVALPTSGPLAGVLTSGISQKAGGAGAVAEDATLSAGSVLYQVTLELAPGAVPGVVFDGANLDGRFKALLRNRLGDDVVGSSGFGIGRLEVAVDATFQQTASL
ncbi:hypothetical protein HPC49_32945 [Pyxidicoccus fallax]|uniref:Big-1 domain-containing protein n=1 Tax=Pyxidicoccus fallax TaxID=394095 RepID=A0A848LUE6_9BACT|nr:hypothetical protein [Pyxidicoccus fallax]NMO21637.1 hypothetical protein [Pyxidicoccus fallax]NPC83017.1 hypothetical protein [Pyxidicoccus fallax]